MKNDLDRKPEPGDQSLVDWRPNWVSVTVIPYSIRKGFTDSHFMMKGISRSYGGRESCEKKLPACRKFASWGNAYEETQRNDLQEQIPLTRLGRSVNTWYG